MKADEKKGGKLIMLGPLLPLYLRATRDLGLRNDSVLARRALRPLLRERYPEELDELERSHGLKKLYDE